MFANESRHRDVWRGALIRVDLATTPMCETLSDPFPTQQMPRLPPTPGDLID